ncbi:sugar transferase [Leptolyngbya sp. FACHB-36]|uniref:sugar transferase n=1 Tax=Leptolyngbya sp. FACHB-36 TaxID=2692808 RepID=UPI001F559532|nr:sugar transferase [Leptolyngbya sp. FACHB-36]
MILVTVGTEQYPFNALMDWIDVLIRYRFIDPDEEIIVQYGSSNRLPDRVKVYRRLPESEFRSLVEQARVVIGHCGEGTALLLESLDKPYVLVPRARLFGEHVDDHQLEMANAMEKQGVQVARSPADLVRFLAAPRVPSVLPQSDDELCRMLVERYRTDRYKKLMLVCSSGGHFTAMQALKPFWARYNSLSWVTFRTPSTEAELLSRSDSMYWAHSPTNRNLPNLVRNLILGLGVLRQERPELVISTGAGVAVPFLLLAKYLCGSKIIFVESKTRLEQLSLSARILQFFSAMDLLVVRSEELARRFPTALGAACPTSTAAVKDATSPQPVVIQSSESAMLSTPAHFGAQAAEAFVQTVWLLAEAHPKVIVVDLSATSSIDAAGLQALLAGLKSTKAIGAELALWSVTPPVMSVLLRARFDRLFKIDAATVATRTPATLRAVAPLTLPASVRTPVKRSIDIAAAAVGLLVTALLVVPIAIALRLESSDPVFVGQTRSLSDGRRFRVWKFRTSATRTLDLLDSAQSESDRSEVECQSPTLIGRFLRRTQLDKLPLCWNVLIGDLSLFELRTPSLDEIDLVFPVQRRVVSMPNPIPDRSRVSAAAGMEEFEDTICLKSNTTGS